MIDKFDGEFSFLSNFAFSPIEFNKQNWNTVEHLFQAAKTLNKIERENIRNSQTPGQAKRLGKKVTLRNDWDNIKYNVMLVCVQLKFKQNPKLAKKLLNTKDEILVEGNWWHDNIWGNCNCDKCKDIKGKNWLGEILMKVREEIKISYQ